jgi:hypothetical protein
LERRTLELRLALRFSLSSYIRLVIGWEQVNISTLIPLCCLVLRPIKDRGALTRISGLKKDVRQDLYLFLGQKLSIRPLFLH